MNCTKCGSEIIPEQKYCEKCGALNESAYQSEDTAGSSFESMAAENTSYKQHTEQLYPCNEGYNDVEDNRKTGGNMFSKKLLKIFVPIIVILALCIGAYAHPVWRNSIIRLVKSDKQYLMYIADNGIDKCMSDMTFGTGILKEVSDGKSGVSLDVGLEADKSVWDLVDKISNQEISNFLNWLNSVGLSLDIGTNDNTYGVGAEIKVNNKFLADANVVVNGNDVYVSTPSLNDKSLYVKGAASNMNSNFGEIAEAANVLSKIFPDEKIIENILKRYSRLVIENINEVTENNITVSAASVSQSAVEITAKLDYESLVNILKSCIGEAQKDNDIKNIIKNMCDAGVIDGNFEEVYFEFTKSLSEAHDKLLTEKPDMDFAEIPFKFIVSNRGELIGIDVSYNDEGFKYYSTADGKKTGLKISFDFSQGSAVFEGSGEVSGDKLSGSYSLTAMGMDILKVSVENLDVKSMNKGIYNGVVKLAPGETAKALLVNTSLDKELVSFVSDMEIVIESSSKSEESGNASVVINNNSQKLFALNLGYAKSEKPVYTIPESYIDANNDEKMNEWLNKTGKALVNNLKDTGIPSYLLYFME